MSNLTLHPACIRCKETNTLKRDLVDDDGNVEMRKGHWPIDCSGIPLDYKELLETRIGNPELLSKFTEEENELLLQGLDPTRWAKRWLLQEKGGWKTRGATPFNMDKYQLDEDAKEYQEIMLKCTARRKVFRMGRRTGKTEAIAVRILHSMVTWAHGNCKVLLVCPYRSQIDLVFKRIRELIHSSATLQNSIRRQVSNPYHEIELFNGSYIRGFSAGTNSGSNASSVRGQAADIIVMDEMDYLNPGDIDSITAILMDHQETQLWASSTPTGRRDKFFEFCHAPEFKQFYFPSMANPNWNDSMEREFRRISTKSGYIHEVLADFGEEDIGVFKKTDIDTAIQLGTNYSYAEMIPNTRWAYSIGVDWNPVKGTEIVVVGARRPTEDMGDVRFRVVATHTIEKQEFTEMAANEAIIALNRQWNPLAIYLDYGGGGVNHLEQLRMFSKGKDTKTADGRIRLITKVIDFGKSIEIFDPWSKQSTKKPMKPVMVENAVRKMEQHRIELSSHDNVLTAQMQNYIIQKVTVTGRPVYGMSNELVGDHRLDAFMLAMLAFQMEATEFGKPRWATGIRIAGKLGEKVSDAVLRAQGQAKKGMQEELKQDLQGAQQRNPDTGFGPRFFKGKNVGYASDLDHERAWDARIAKKRRSSFGRHSGQGTRSSGPSSRNSRGIPRRKNI